MIRQLAGTPFNVPSIIQHSRRLLLSVFHYWRFPYCLSLYIIHLLRGKSSLLPLLCVFGTSRNPTSEASTPRIRLVEKMRQRKPCLTPRANHPLRMTHDAFGFTCRARKVNRTRDNVDVAVYCVSLNGTRQNIPSASNWTLALSSIGGFLMRFTVATAEQIGRQRGINHPSAIYKFNVLILRQGKKTTKFHIAGQSEHKINLVHSDCT